MRIVEREHGVDCLRDCLFFIPCGYSDRDERIRLKFALLRVDAFVNEREEPEDNEIEADVECDPDKDLKCVHETVKDACCF